MIYNVIQEFLAKHRSNCTGEGEVAVFRPSAGIAEVAKH